MNKARIIATLRRLYLMSPQRSECLTKHRIRRGVYKCKQCGKEFSRKEIEVHHIIPVAKMEVWDWNIFIERLFEGETIVLCKKCHKEQTKNNRQK